jgi:hypothetical protein
MGGLFAPKAPKVEKPKPVRMPVQTDPEIEAAAARNRDEIMRRRGRLSTIMTDMTKSTTGSSGQKLGA